MRQSPRRIKMKRPAKILLDSTYLLPVFGIEVEGLTARDLEKLREASLTGEIQPHALTTCWIEILGKVAREAQRRKIDVTGIAEKAIKSLTESETIRWIKPEPEALRLALKLRLLGHRDMIDNLLYATAVTRGMTLLTMDSGLVHFLRKHNLPEQNIKKHTELYH